jgi:hypothetical protein
MSGGLRTFISAYPSFAEQVLAANADEFDFDVFGNFLYFPGDADEENALAKLQETMPELRSFSKSPLDDLRKATENWHSATFGAEFNERVLSKDQFPHPPLNVLTMLNSIQLADKERREYEEKHGFVFDLVIRARPDLMWKAPLPLNQIELPAESDAVYLPWFNEELKLAFDQFAVASSPAMTKYARGMEAAGKVVADPELCDIYAEKLMYHHLRSSEQLTLHTLEGYEALLARPDGEVDPFAKLKKDFPAAFD